MKQGDNRLCECVLDERKPFPVCGLFLCVCNHRAYADDHVVVADPLLIVNTLTILDLCSMVTFSGLKGII